MSGGHRVRCGALAFFFPQDLCRRLCLGVRARVQHSGFAARRAGSPRQLGALLALTAWRIVLLLDTPTLLPATEPATCEPWPAGGREGQGET